LRDKTGSGGYGKASGTRLRSLGHLERMDETMLIKRLRKEI